MGRIAVIGATGQIGAGVVRGLAQAGADVVAIQRRPAYGSETQPWSVRTVAAYEPEQLRTALDGCDSAIVTLGLPYNSAIWLRDWPRLMGAVLQAAADTGSSMTVLDNMYVYGAASPLSESTPLAPASRKGVARLEAWNQLRAARESGQDLVVCRAADFMGPGIERTLVPWSALAAVARGSRRVVPWIGDPGAKHSFAWGDQVARALIAVDGEHALRGDGVIHVPAIQPFSGVELATELSRCTGHRVRVMPLRERVMAVAGVFSVMARESREMMYQSEHEFVVDDAKFRRIVQDERQLTLKDVVAHAVSSE